MVGNDARDRDRNARPDADEGDLSERLQRLETALKRARKDDGAGERRGTSSGSAAHGMAQALRLASEFAAGVLVGGGIGYLFDRVLGTSPWGLIVFLLLGFVAGVLNILRSSGLARQPGAGGPS